MVEMRMDNLAAETHMIDVTDAGAALAPHTASEIPGTARGPRARSDEKKKTRSYRYLDGTPEISQTSRSYLWIN
jgi:hypothetical protein